MFPSYLSTPAQRKKQQEEFDRLMERHDWATNVVNRYVNSGASLLSDEEEPDDDES